MALRVRSDRLNRRSRRGIEVVEMALILPILVMITLGILEFGRAYEVTQWLTAGARGGARLGMLYNVVKETDRDKGITTARQKVTQDIKNFLAAQGIKAEDVTVKITNPEGTVDVNLDDYVNIQEKHFKVQVLVPYSKVGVIPGFYLRNANLVGEIVVRHE